MSINTDLLRQTFERAKTENGGLRTLGMAFYQRLFAKYPQVKPLFHTPPEEQHKKLMASVGAILAAVNNPQALLPYLRAMGIRHLKYGTESPQYAAVAENLIAVLAEHLSVEGEWTDEMQTAWQEALKTVCDVMIEAAENPAKYSAEMQQNGYDSAGFRLKGDAPWLLPEDELPTAGAVRA